MLSRNIDFSYIFYAKKRLVNSTDSTYPESAPAVLRDGKMLEYCSISRLRICLAFQKQPPEVSYKKKLFLNISQIFTGKHMCCSLFLKKLLKRDFHIGPFLQPCSFTMEAFRLKQSYLCYLIYLECNFISITTWLYF